ncbi:MAG: hypothetical protein IJC04_05650 [Oscillospiraceae bacterium]|nr:hypothetical protein [Oscillospiraceae bacterium]
MAAASLLLGNPFLAGISSFAAYRCKIHLFGALLRTPAGEERVSLSAESDNGALPP